MAKFCFVSRAQPGHLEFGGMSYIRTAIELKNRENEVQWILSRNKKYDNGAFITRSKNIIKDHGLNAREFFGLHTTAHRKSEYLLKYIRNFAEYLKSNLYDCVVIDRFCVWAAFSAHLAGLPWATIGTDGREWFKKSYRSMVNRGIFPGSWYDSPLSSVVCLMDRNDFPKPSDKSFWATSPFLNISFFPRVYYHDNKNTELPKQSHFLGSGVAPEPSCTMPNYLLVTLGNHFEPVLRRKLAKILRLLIHERSISVLFLAGNVDTAKDLRQTFRNNSRVDVREWMPYDKAYRGAIGVIGHGGTSHIWYGLREGKPLLAVPFIADQLYGGLQLERLNVGRTVIPFLMPRYLSRQFQKLCPNSSRETSIFLSKRKFSRKLNEVSKDPAIQVSCSRFSKLMRTGGGVPASASLIERLAQSRKPVTSCISPSCCC